MDLMDLPARNLVAPPSEHDGRAMVAWDGPEGSQGGLPIWPDRVIWFAPGVRVWVSGELAITLGADWDWLE